MNPLFSSPTVLPSKAGRYLTFTLGREAYGLPVLNVREIIRLCPITPVPNMPSHVRGVINLRGTVIAVLDLRAKFSMATAEYGDRACIIVLQLGSQTDRKTLIGVIVDAVEEVIQLQEGEIEPCPDFGNSNTTQYILGVATVRGGVKTLLQIEKIFAEEGAITWQLLEHLPVNQEIRPQAFLKDGAGASSPSPSSSSFG
jgi:purine-binding chemotaxis protein CheW